MNSLPVWIAAYFFGSIPFGVIVAKSQNINIREHGSGNIGATNVARTLGKKAGIITLIGDCLKGVVAVAVASSFLNQPVEIAIAGFLAFAGHTFSIFLKFKGGKGVATGFGIFIYLMPIATLCAMVVFACAIFATGYVSIGSIAAAITIPIAGYFFQTPQPYIFLAAIVAVLVIQKHNQNIQRLFTGKESRFIRK